METSRGKSKECFLGLRAKTKQKRTEIGEINANNLLEMAQAKPSSEAESSTVAKEADETMKRVDIDIGLLRTDGFSVMSVVGWLVARAPVCGVRRGGRGPWVLVGWGCLFVGVAVIKFTGGFDLRSPLNCFPRVLCFLALFMCLSTAF